MVVGAPGRSTRPVDHHAAANDQVVHRSAPVILSYVITVQIGS
jgi:hypothetical protein